MYIMSCSEDNYIDIFFSEATISGKGCTRPGTGVRTLRANSHDGFPEVPNTVGRWGMSGMFKNKASGRPPDTGIIFFFYKGKELGALHPGSSWI